MRSGYVRYVPVTSADIPHILRSVQVRDEDEDGDEDEYGEREMFSGDLI